MNKFIKVVFGATLLSFVLLLVGFYFKLWELTTIILYLIVLFQLSFVSLATIQTNGYKWILANRIILVANGIMISCFLLEFVKFDFYWKIMTVSMGLALITCLMSQLNSEAKKMRYTQLIIGISSFISLMYSTFNDKTFLPSIVGICLSLLLFLMNSFQSKLSINSK